MTCPPKCILAVLIVVHIYTLSLELTPKYLVELYFVDPLKYFVKDGAQFSLDGLVDCDT